MNALPFAATARASLRAAMACILIMGFSAAVHGEVFSTTDVFEADKCASIWLIQRFVDPDAELRFFPKGTPISTGTPLDVPEARLRRHFNASTYETILRVYDLRDSTLRYIGRIIHDIEINVWEQKALPETPEVQSAIFAIINEGGKPYEIVEKSNRVLDKLYQRIEGESKNKAVR